MPLGPDPELARTAAARLDALRAAVSAAEDDVLACLVVTGEPRPQRVLDDWLDQAADTLRALGERAADLSPTLSRFAGGPDPGSAGALGTAPDAGASGATPDAGSAGALGTASDAVADLATPLDVAERS